MAQPNPSTPYLILTYLSALTISSRTHTYIFARFFPLYPGYHFPPILFTILSGILSVVAILIGQLIIGHIVGDGSRNGKRNAMKLVTASFLVSALAMLLTLTVAVSLHKYNILVSIVVRLAYYVAPLFGASGESVAFLAIILLNDEFSSQDGEEEEEEQDEKRKRRRSAFFYGSGGVVFISSMLAGFILEAALFWRFGFVVVLGVSIVLGAFAWWVAEKIKLVGDDNGGERVEGLYAAVNGEEEPERGRLIPGLPEPEVDDTLAGEGPQAADVGDGVGFFEGYKQILVESGNRARAVFVLFFLLGISKAVSPWMALTYAARWGIVDWHQVRILYLVCPLVSIVILAVVLPLTLLKSSWSDVRLNLLVGRASIVLLALGSFLIGFFRPSAVIIAGVVISALGAATDLSILAFFVGDVDRNVAGRTIMLISAFEKIGLVVGIGGLFPAYSWSTGHPSLAGGLPSFICSGLYAVGAGILFLKFKSAPNSIALP
ncbi:hypothetical protein QBC44DRAFT_314639 [Cladorrhinum sp. PSN332]|nr:hypothetical protein QBC44DRAFT_314639 [Cladorrhinum sp. PSN332]